MRVCVQCGRTFRPSSRHLRCPSCRSRDTCSCGRSKQRKSRTCSWCRPTGREFNGYWKGGRTKHKAGYVMIRVANHPRGGTNGYVFEHILVMEEILGRHLSPDETVHHRNGVRDDNRPQNLELWVRPQPSGVRVQDAVEWAHEILGRYEGLDVTSKNAPAQRRSALGRGRKEFEPRPKCRLRRPSKTIRGCPTTFSSQAKLPISAS